MEKSYSLPKLQSQSSMKRENSSKMIDSRLNFPIPGDSSIFSNVGRKHYANHSDRMLKIILPQKYATQKPIRIHREASLPPPHLVRHTSERIFQNRAQINEDIKKIYARDTSLRDKIEDELDRMRKSMERQKKPINLPIIKVPESTRVAQAKIFPSSSKNIRQNEAKISTLFSLTPAVSIKIQSKPKQSPRLLYNPENKEKYDSLLMGRWKNPTNLSTGLGII